MPAVVAKALLVLLLAGGGCAAVHDYSVIDPGSGDSDLLDTSDIVLDARATTWETIDNELQLKEQGDGVPDYYKILFIMDAVVNGKHERPFLRLALRPFSPSEAKLLDAAWQGFRYNLPLRIGFDLGAFGRIQNLRFMRAPAATRPTSR